LPCKQEQPLAILLSEMNPVHFNINFACALQPKLRLQVLFLFQVFCALLLHPLSCYWAPHLVLLDVKGKGKVFPSTGLGGP
jgi:hypothetical protein